MLRVRGGKSKKHDVFSLIPIFICTFALGKFKKQFFLGIKTILFYHIV